MSTASPTVTPIGADIAHAKVDAAAGSDGQYNTQVFPHTPMGLETFLMWLRPVAPAHVCLEATGR